MAWGCTGGGATPMAPEDKRIVEEPEIGASRKVEERVEAAEEDEGRGKALRQSGMARQLQVGAAAALLQDAPQAVSPQTRGRRARPPVAEEKVVEEE